MKVAILISGGGSNMVALLDSMVGDHPARPVLVLSNDPAAKGLQRASDRGVPTKAIDHRDFPDRLGFEAALHDALTAVGAEVLCLAGFMRILTPSFVAMWEGRCLNIHPSLLPKFRGLNTHQRAIDAGESLHGCTVHEVSSELDAGAILGQRSVPVLPADTAAVLAARVLLEEHQLYPKVLREFFTRNHGRLSLNASE